MPSKLPTDIDLGAEDPAESTNYRDDKTAYNSNTDLDTDLKTSLDTSLEKDFMIDALEEACGVFAVLDAQEDVAKLTYFGLYALQHRGQESAGITTFDADGKSHTHKAMGLVSQVFNEEILATLPGIAAIGHTRYSTTGASKINNAQPIVVPTRLGDFALAHNGNLVNTLELRTELLEQGHILNTTIDSEGIAYAVAEAVDRGQDWIDGIIHALKRCQGAFSLVMGTPKGIAATRDSRGIRPLVIGKLPSGAYVFSSETCGLDIIGAEYFRDVEPGELVWVDAEGLRSHRWVEKATPKLCIFEMIYFARPDSEVHGEISSEETSSETPNEIPSESLYSYRMRLGKILAQESPVEADLVIGVPDSGIPAAIGFSQASGISFMEGLIKNRYVGRTFIQPTQAMRESGIRMKLNPLRDVLKGKRIVVIDDSIVRGTTSRKMVQTLREAGATEVHMRISSPPVTHPCFYGIDTDSQDHLIAATQSVEAIAKIINVDSLSYLSWDAMLQATNIDPSHFCSACFTGDYPIPVPDQLKRTKLILEPQHHE